MLENNKDINKKCIECIKNIYVKEGLNGICEYAEKVEAKNYFFKMVSLSISKKCKKEMIDLCNRKNKNIAKLFVNELEDDILVDYVNDRLNMKNIEFISMHFVTKKIFDFIVRIEKKYQKKYWDLVSLHRITELDYEYLEKFINKLFDYNNYEKVIQTLYIILDKYGKFKLKNDYIYRALEGYNFCEDNKNNSIDYYIQYLIYFLEDELDKETNRILNIEIKYICLMGYYDNISPKFINLKMLNEPQYVVEILYKMKNQKEKEYIKLNYSKLIYNFKIYLKDLLEDKFDVNNIYLWKNCIEKIEDDEIYNEMLGVFGIILGLVPEDNDGFILNRKIADLLEKRENKILRIYFEIGIFNQYNSINVNQNGIVIENIIKKYDRMALSCEKEGYIYLAEVYRNVVKKYQYFFEEV